MSNPPQTGGKMRIVNEEEFQLTTIAGSGETENNSACNAVIIHTEECAASCRNDKNHRKLAISSIICGISCIGILSLIYSVRAEEAADAGSHAGFLRKAKKYGIISILTWVAILVFTPMLIVLTSYLLTLID